MFSPRQPFYGVLRIEGKMLHPPPTSALNAFDFDSRRARPRVGLVRLCMRWDRARLREREEIGVDFGV